MRVTVALLLIGFLNGCADQTPTGNVIPIQQDVGNGNWLLVSAGRDHTCALTNDGRAFCWGSNATGQLGLALVDSVCGSAQLPCTMRPVPVATTLRFQTVSAGALHSCGVARDGTAYCWGDNSYGQLGPGGGAGGVGPGLIRVPGDLPYTDISAGYSHTCAVRVDGVGVCWGANDRGQLGTGNTVASELPVAVSGAPPLRSIRAGQGRSCALSVSGSVLCWGAVWVYSQGGLEYTVSQPLPAAVPQAPPLVSLSVGTFTTCGADAEGSAYCWEANQYGQMGNGTTLGSTIPLPVQGGLRFTEVSAGIIQTCGIASSGLGYCWGNDTFGQLGQAPSNLGERCAAPTLVCSTRPVQVYGWQRFVSISTSFGNHSCGVTVLGNLYCWGLGTSGQLGYGVRIGAEAIPILVAPPLL